jgi:3-phenylpropionate/trans-cinnamate dioxygenase ferredoxin component
MLHYALELNDLKDVLKKRVVVNEKPLLLVYVENQVYAISDKCPHLGASLDKGTLDGHSVTCKAHHAKIDVKTGDIIDKAQILFIKMPTKQAKTYPVHIKNQKVFIEFPDQI